MLSTYVVWILGAVTLVAAVYGLHRLGLYLEARGLLYYWHKKPGSGGASAFTPLQEIVQPQIRHVIEVKDQKRVEREDDAGEPVHPRPQPTAPPAQEAQPPDA
jgi:hypothetical protein